MAQRTCPNHITSKESEMRTKTLINCIATATIAPTLCAMTSETNPNQTKKSKSTNKKPAITEIKIDWPGKHSERVETPQGYDEHGNELPPEVWYTEPCDKIFLNINDTWEIDFEILPKNADTTTLIWKTNNPNVAKVSKGIVKALNYGRAEITVTTPDKKVSAKVTFVVNRIIVE